jgi:type IV pilus assembly protein PilA
VFLVRLRKRLGARLENSEAGFTLVELLIVMLILSILASIALPAFFNQKTKAGDTKAKEYAHTAEVTLETYATANGASGYENATIAKLKEIEPSLNSAGTFTVTGSGGTGNPTSTGYQITVTSTTGNTFSVKNVSGVFTFTCTVTAATSRGGCPGSGTTAGTWG